MPKKIVVVGGGAAGLDAALNARRTSRDADIKLINAEDKPAYSRCALPFVIGGDIHDFSHIVIYKPEFYKMMKIDLKLKTTVTEVDPSAKVVKAVGPDGKEESFEYDSLILATGARAIVPPIKGHDKKGVYPLRTIDDASAILQEALKAKSAVVVGAGLVGLEAAEGLVKRGVKVTVIEALHQVLRPILDEDMAKILQSRITAHGVRLMLSTKAEEILGDNHVKAVAAGGETIDADLVIMAVGVRANTDLAVKAGCKLGVTGGIKVDARMKTSVDDIYAAGDCVESVHLVTMQPILCQLGTVAVKQGKVAGINAAGGYATFPGVLGSAVSKIFDVEVGFTGLTEWQAKQAGFDVVVGTVPWRTRAEYYPGSKEIRVKLIFEKASMKLIGAQILGGEGVAPRVDALSLAIQKGMTAYELAKADTCYTPPLADTWSPITLAAEAALKRI
ncbi:MAG: pyridine nucleotide-disulfide oxidoreductase [Thermoprotei archaeon]|nr:MAG: pyridine nucleotide-disulfide oxidoreductase [Thermoprotei archaeon]